MVVKELKFSKVSAEREGRQLGTVCENSSPGSTIDALLQQCVIALSVLSNIHTMPAILLYVTV
jgi:hypothetical protein